MAAKRLILGLLFAINVAWTLVIQAYDTMSIVDDVQKPDGLIAHGLHWLFTTPWPVPAAIALFVALFIIRWAQPQENVARRLPESFVREPRSSHEQPSKSDLERLFEEWAKISPISVNQAALLWTAEAPIPSAIERIRQHLTNEIRAGHISADHGPNPNAARGEYGGSQVTRDELKKAAHSVGERPKFLYPETRQDAPMLDADTGGKISARDAQLTASLPFPLARATNRGEVSMDRARFIFAPMVEREIPIDDALYTTTLRWPTAKRWGEDAKIADGSERELRVMTMLARDFETKAMNGDLVIRGRRRGEIEYRDIEPDFWRAAYLHVEAAPPNHARLYIITIRPSSGVADARRANIQARDYDGLIVNAERVKFLWPA